MKESEGLCLDSKFFESVFKDGKWKFFSIFNWVIFFIFNSLMRPEFSLLRLIFADRKIAFDVSFDMLKNMTGLYFIRKTIMAIKRKYLI